MIGSDKCPRRKGQREGLCRRRRGSKYAAAQYSTVEWGGGGPVGFGRQQGMDNVERMGRDVRDGLSLTVVREIGGCGLQLINYRS